MIGRRHRLAQAVSLLLLCLLPVGAACDESGGVPGGKEWLDRAGNATDQERLELLKQLRAAPGLSQPLADDVDPLIGEVERWLHEPRLEYYGREFWKEDDYDLGIAQESPLYPLTHLYRGRAVAWATLEYGGSWKDPTVRRARLDKVRALFELAKAAFPENRIVRMYLGEPLPSEKVYPAPEDAPEWAVWQREGLERLADIVEWWIDHRMQPDAQYGGGWGDDCEMWRWWIPVLVAFEDEKIMAAQAKFSNALWAQPHMKGGYTSHVFDVEHTAEDSADTLCPMMQLAPGEPLWRDRALRLVELMETRWTGVNTRGLLQFKSTYFSAEKVEEDPRKACDTVYHPRAMQPALLLWQRTNDAKLGKLFTSWLDTWAGTAMREERGKPAGVVPSAIHWPDGQVGGLGENWWDPENHDNDPLYVWPSAMGLMLNALLQAHYQTGEARYLQPLRAMAALRVEYLRDPKADPPPGSAAWCAKNLDSLTAIAAKYRLLTGKPDFDELIAQEESPYLQFRLHGNLDGLTQALRENAEALRINWPGYTSEVRYTDRVLRFPALFGENGMFPEAVPGIPEPVPGLLYSTATGDPDNGVQFPINAVRWKTPPRDIAALVTKSGSDEFEALLYHFGQTLREMGAELFLLAPGRYEMELGGEEGEVVRRLVEIEAGERTVKFTVAARETCTFRLWRIRD